MGPLIRTLALTLLALSLPTSLGCASISIRKSTSMLDFLYPRGTPAIPPRDVELTIPLRIGLAFAPPGTDESDALPGGLRLAVQLSEAQKQLLLQRIADAFEKRDYIASVEPIPSLYLKPGGSFENLDQLATAMGLNLVVLLSYDQAQFNETSKWSLTYATIVGAYVVKGENNQTHTLIDGAVYDISSRALLFRTSGADVRGSRSTPVETPKAFRSESSLGFEAATDRLIENLSVALKDFGEQAVSGTVRGAGTPAIEVKPAPEYSGVVKFEGGRYSGGGAGAVGLSELLMLSLLGSAALLAKPSA